MFTLLGESLPDLMGLIIAPGSIVIAVVFLATAGGLRKAWFMWLGGIIGAFTLTYLFHFLGAAGSSSTGKVPAWEGWFDVVAGVLFAYLLIPQLKALRHPNPAGPAWLSAIDKFGPMAALGIGLYQGALNPKSIPLLMHIGMTAGAAKLPTGELLAYAAIIAVLALIPVLIPTLIAQFSGSEGQKILDELRDFMTKNSAIIMSVLFVVLAAVFLSKGIGVLAG